MAVLRFGRVLRRPLMAKQQCFIVPITRGLSGATPGEELRWMIR
jgi:hypothetical protein